MKYDSVIGIGCSFMNGDCIKTEDGDHVGFEAVSANLIANKLNLPYIHLAQTGSSNKKIIRRLVNWFINNPNRNPLVIIGLSELSRVEFYSEFGDFYFDLHPSVVGVVDDEYYRQKSIRFFGKDDNDYRDFFNFYSKYIHNDLYEKELLTVNLTMLDSFLKMKNIDYIIFNSLYAMDDEDLANILNENNLLRFENDISWRDYLLRKHFEYAKFINKDGNDISTKSYRPPYGKYFCKGHPSPNAHVELADFIYAKLENNNWV